jgi:hypothetical protein
LRRLTTRRLVSLASLALLVLPFPWLAPGLLIAHLLRRGRGDGPDGLTRLPLAFAAPALALPWLRLLQLPWQETWLGLSALSLVALTVGAARSPERRWSPVATGWLLLVGAVYLLPHFRQPAPSGVDMGMHLTFARLLLDGNVVPSTQDPFFPGVPFGLYPLGFHAPTALIAGLWGDLGRSGLAAAALSHGLFVVAVYLCLRRGPGFDRTALGAAVAVVWLSRSPQNYVAWGGNPFVLGAGFALVALRRLLDALADGRRRTWLEAALLAVAGALTHPTAAVVMLYAGMAMVAWRAVTRRDLARRALTAALPALAVGMLLLAPLAPSVTGLELSENELAWIRAEMKTPPHAPLLSWGGGLRHVVGQFGDTLLLVVLVVGLLRAGRDGGRGLLVALAGVVASESLAMLAVGSWLPLTATLVPERVMPFALPLLAVPLRNWFDDLAGLRGRWRRGAGARAVLAGELALLAVLVALGAFKHLQYYHRGLRDGQIVTDADREALAWLADHAPPGGLILTEYDDAGQFVPALAGRPHSMPQVNPIWMDEARAALATMEPTLGFTGARRWAGRERAPADPRRGATVFEATGDRGPACVWRLLRPAAATSGPSAP